MVLNDNQIWKMLYENPTAAFEYFENHGVNFDKISQELDIGRRLVVERFKMDEQSMQAADFVFWICYYAERELSDTILKIEKILNNQTSPLIEGMLDKLSFGDKIALVKQYYSNNSDDFIKVLWKINTLRNNVAHGRIQELNYENLKLSNAKGQILLLMDFIKASKNKNEKEN